MTSNHADARTRGPGTSLNDLGWTVSAMHWTPPPEDEQPPGDDDQEQQQP